MTPKIVIFENLHVTSSTLLRMLDSNKSLSITVVSLLASVNLDYNGNVLWYPLTPKNKTYWMARSIIADKKYTDRHFMRKGHNIHGSHVDRKESLTYQTNLNHIQVAPNVHLLPIIDAVAKHRDLVIIVKPQFEDQLNFESLVKELQHPTRIVKRQSSDNTSTITVSDYEKPQSQTPVIYSIGEKSFVTVNNQGLPQTLEIAQAVSIEPLSVDKNVGLKSGMDKGQYQLLTNIITTSTPYLLTPPAALWGGKQKALNREIKQTIDIFISQKEISTISDKHNAGSSNKQEINAINRMNLLELSQHENTHIQRQWKSLESQWIPYELDITLMLQYPAMSDMEVPSTFDFHKSKTHTKKVLSNYEQGKETYKAAEKAISDTQSHFDRALNYAKKVKALKYSPEEQTRLKESLSLAYLALDENSHYNVRSNAARKLVKNVDGIITVPSSFMKEIEK